MTTPRRSFEQPGAENRVVDAPALRRAITDSTAHDDAFRANINDLSLRGDSRDSSTTPSTKPLVPPAHAWRTLFSQEIAHDWVLELQLMLMTVSTGILDATTFSTFSVFATKQTGNTLFLALYAFGHPSLGPEVEKNVATSISLFVLGAAFFGHLSRYVHQKRRAWLLASNLFQTVLLFAATAIRHWAPHSETGPATLGILALTSFASGGQIVGAVTVGMAELNTTMITGTLVQLSNDSKLFKPRNPTRNRRLGFFVSLLIGCFAGVGAVRYRDASVGLLVAACVKGLASVSFIFNHGMIVVDEAVDPEKRQERRASGAATPISKILWGD
ncbi:hypothetical protein KC354_g10793 [Hortaea werneckii]|nr:hypothetical protein KC354_g10793 [Hortaea werneckii]